MVQAEHYINRQKYKLMRMCMKYPIEANGPTTSEILTCLRESQSEKNRNNLTLTSPTVAYYICKASYAQWRLMFATQLILTFLQTNSSSLSPTLIDDCEQTLTPNFQFAVGLTLHISMCDVIQLCSKYTSLHSISKLVCIL